VIPKDSLEYWKDRLRQNNARLEVTERRFKDEEFLTFHDPDDLKLELITSSALSSRFVPWERSPIPEKHAIRGFHGIGLSEEGYERTASLLKETPGFPSGRRRR
jgi:glyoxalase family protein